MSEEDENNDEESIADKLGEKLDNAYNSGNKSYEMKVRDGAYWKKVQRYSKLKDIIEGNI